MPRPSSIAVTYAVDDDIMMSLSFRLHQRRHSDIAVYDDGFISLWDIFRSGTEFENYSMYRVLCAIHRGKEQSENRYTVFKCERRGWVIKDNRFPSTPPYQSCQEKHYSFASPISPADAFSTGQAPAVAQQHCQERLTGGRMAVDQSTCILYGEEGWPRAAARPLDGPYDRKVENEASYEDGTNKTFPSNDSGASSSRDFVSHARSLPAHQTLESVREEDEGDIRFEALNLLHFLQIAYNWLCAHSVAPDTKNLKSFIDRWWTYTNKLPFAEVDEADRTSCLAYVQRHRPWLCVFQ